MTISLTPEADRFVAEVVERGRFASPAAVVAEALRLLEAQERKDSPDRAEFNVRLSERLAAADRGEFVDPLEVREALRRKSVERQQAAE